MCAAAVIYRWQISETVIVICSYELQALNKSNKRYRYLCYRPWRPLGLREVKAPTLLRQTANRWWQGCQPYAPAALYPQVSFLRFLVLISVRG
jgi:hypothetical protein